jgi:hypothetical protein
VFDFLICSFVSVQYFVPREGKLHMV